MALLLNWRVWFVITFVASLAFGSYKCVQFGKNSVQVEFDKYKNQQILDALAVEKANQAKEQVMKLSLENLTNAYVKNQKANSDNAIAANNSLRDLQTTIGNPTPIDPATSIGVDDLARARFVVGDCATTLSKMAEAFDASEARLSALQEYVKNVVQK